MADKSKLLIVEDDADTSDMLREYFNSRGYKVLTAAWGSDALELCRRIPPDVIILDIRLPDINGYDVYQELRSNLQTSRTPIIFLTQQNEREDIIAGLKLGAVDYITKPFDIEELELRVRNALQQTSYQSLVSPITDLANRLLEEQLKPLLGREKWAALYIGINDLTLFSETYSFKTVDDALQSIALILDTVVKELGTISDFAGYLGEGNFIVITTPDRVQGIKEEIVARLGRGNNDSSYYVGDRTLDFMKPNDTKGVDLRTPLISISVGVITNEKAALTKVRNQ